MAPWRFRCEKVLAPSRFRLHCLHPSVQSVYSSFTTMNVRRKIFKTQHFQRQVKKYSEHCCVPLCTASSKFNGYLSFHGFPVQTELRRRWLGNIRRDHFTISSHTKVCSRHFTPDQLVEPKTSDGRRRLVKGAVPLLFQWNGYSIIQSRGSSGGPVSPQHLIKDHDYCVVPEPEPLGLSCAENEALSREVEELRNRLQSYTSGGSSKTLASTPGNV